MQPVVTTHDTPGAHALRMRPREQETQSAATAEELPEFDPWRHIGWIFRDGDCIAIERQGDETRAGLLGE